MHTIQQLQHRFQGDGMPDDDQGWSFNEEQSIEHYLAHVQQWLQFGARVIGGCCGTSPSYIQPVTSYPPLTNGLLLSSALATTVEKHL